MNPFFIFLFFFISSLCNIYAFLMYEYILEKE